MRLFYLCGKAKNPCAGSARTTRIALAAHHFFVYNYNRGQALSNSTLQNTAVDDKR
jgi:hypothetical protein